jgi:hypothetical protein
MLKVGFLLRYCQREARARPLSPVNAGVVPAFTLKSNVAAMLDTPVKCIA